MVVIFDFGLTCYIVFGCLNIGVYFWICWYFNVL